MSQFAQGPGGAQIAYDLAGDGPPVVLIHGFAASRIITWRNTNWVNWLTRAGHRVVALDCRGHGESGKPHEIAAYDDRIMVADLLAVLDHAGIGRADIVGYSMGGYLTMNLMHLAPERVGRAILAGVGENYFSFWPDRNEIIAEGLLAGDLAKVSNPLALEFRTFAIRAGNDLSALAACMRRERIALAKEQIGTLPHPVLVVCGESDRISGRPEPLAELFPNGRAFVVPKRNHHSAVGDLRFKEAAKAFLQEEAVPGPGASAS